MAEMSLARRSPFRDFAQERPVWHERIACSKYRQRLAERLARTSGGRVVLGADLDVTAFTVARGEK
jgi:hypothetical protein